MRIQKKTLISIVGGAVILGVIGLTVYLVSLKEETRMSESKKLAVDRVFDGMKVKNSTTLKGKYSGPDDAKLYYLVSLQDHNVIGSDSITIESDDTFTANLQLNTAGYQDKSGEMKIYAQNNQGQVVDVVNVKIGLE